ncbi:MAG: hypothetical protein CSA66_07680 [Proteobacteria bacterium]|nr:MAG: hypothetical protein CSA66_07680 [Pseudomonadota bacterium]
MDEDAAADPDAAADSSSADSSSADTAAADSSAADTASADTAAADTSSADTSSADTSEPPGPVAVSERHWRLVFADEFTGKREGDARDAYCFDDLAPQCHIWPGGDTHHCDRSDKDYQDYYPPTKANLVAALKLVDPETDYDAMTRREVEVLYGQVLRERLQHLDKCTWTLYEMVNWMATDYHGQWSARFDPTQVEVDPAGKGYLRLSATYAPVEYDCIFGGVLGGPNCQIYAFADGVLVRDVHYWVDPNPAWPGVYYAPVDGACPHGGTYGGVNCQILAFADGVLEESGVDYWVDIDPQWPGVYYANRPYRCRNNIDYGPLVFRNLTCPVLDGGVMSYAFSNRGWVDEGGVSHGRGHMQQHGRFEAKARIPKGVGAFPAVWLMPESGGWPYDGGEIDIMEARDAADEVYHTYHNGKCYDPETEVQIEATDSRDCDDKGGTSTHLSKGFTIKERARDEFWKRDHLFAVEWVGDRLDYYINDVHTGTVRVGTEGRIDEDAPAHLATFDGDDFPFRPFYWILNHSTWVPEAHWETFGPQVHAIDYVRSYVLCGSDPLEYCPDGGAFVEGEGCHLGGAVYDSPCAPAHRECVNGGVRAGRRCRVWDIAAGTLHSGVEYWTDVDPARAGVYYAASSGSCPHGGTLEGESCRVIAMPGDVLESGIDYVVDRGPAPPGVYYIPDFLD